MFYGDYVRLATREEVATKKMVEEKFGERADEVFDLMGEEEVYDLCDGVVRGSALLAILAECEVSAEDLCVWYFTEEA